VVKLVGKTTTLNQINVAPEIIRGGIFTNVGSGAVSEAAISTGGILSYSLPPGKKAKFKGTITPTLFGSNARMSVNIFDNSAGRIIPVGMVVAADALKSKTFEGVLENDDFDFTVDGDSAMNNGQLTCIMEITELPA